MKAIIKVGITNPNGAGAMELQTFENIKEAIEYADSITQKEAMANLDITKDLLQDEYIDVWVCIEEGLDGVVPEDGSMLIYVKQLP